MKGKGGDATCFATVKKRKECLPNVEIKHTLITKLYLIIRLSPSNTSDDSSFIDKDLVSLFSKITKNTIYRNPFKILVLLKETQ